MIILISVENLKSTRRFSAAFPPFFSADARIGLQKTTKNPLKNQLRIFLSFRPQRVYKGVGITDFPSAFERA